MAEDDTSAWATDREAPHDVTVEIWSGDREPLRPLFELAEDSATQLDGYLPQDIVLAAYVCGAPVGHLQLVDTGTPEEVELKNMAVLPAFQGQGVGGRLVEKAVGHARTHGWRTMLVGTASADVGNLRFNQRQGFRMLSVERDAFVPGTGYPDAIDIDGIPLRDRVWLDRAVDE